MNEHCLVTTHEPRLHAMMAPAPRAHRVLVVDDNADAAESLASLLALDGHVTQVCGDAAAALALLDAFEPTVVLLDIELPRMSGVELAAHIRARPEGRTLRLVAMTGFDEGQPGAGARMGFDAYLTKPVDPELLQRALD